MSSKIRSYDPHPIDSDGIRYTTVESYLISRLVKEPHRNVFDNMPLATARLYYHYIPTYKLIQMSTLEFMIVCMEILEEVDVHPTDVLSRWVKYAMKPKMFRRWMIQLLNRNI